jgi:hypothetical protein
LHRHLLQTAHLPEGHRVEFDRLRLREALVASYCGTPLRNALRMGCPQSTECR